LSAKTNEAHDVEIHARPVLKWAGGKTQMLSLLTGLYPSSGCRYIEPFFGGGALFFALNPIESIISDSNPELINLYTQIASEPDAIISALSEWHNDESLFYELRSLDWEQITPSRAAARTIFLNRTCYNGLYRVNRKGQFNVPFGKYKNPKICDVDNIRAASHHLSNAEIILADYKAVLQKAERGDFVFLDPPYLPISESADFKRYTKEQFYEEDHEELAEEAKRLQSIGCHVVLTNSNHPLVHDLYSSFEISVHQTRRNVSSNSKTRKGEDVIVIGRPLPVSKIRPVPNPIPPIVNSYPSTRYMGSKEKLLPYIQNVAENFSFETAADLFSGSGVVSYLFKSMGKSVFSNDYMHMSSTFAKAMIANSDSTLSNSEIDKLFIDNGNNDHFVERTFADLYFSNDDNKTIDIVRSNIKKIRNTEKRAIAMSALMRACLKKRARGIFTYTGLRYDDGRADLKKSIDEHVRDAAVIINQAIFDNGKENIVRNGDAMTASTKADLVYLDPPYYSQHSDNEYVRRYHFLEGLARDWNGVQIQTETKTKKFRNYPTPFSSRLGAVNAFDSLFKRMRNSVILLSYSSNSLPSKDELISLMARYKDHVEVIDIDHKYSFGNQKHKIDDNKNAVKEYLFVGF